MSGKEPPRAPRALLNSFPASAASSIASTSNASPATRLGIAPPTGPRSLANSPYPAQSPHRGGRGKIYVNGYGSTASPPTGPNPTRLIHKGKQVEAGWNGSSILSVSQTSQPQANGIAGPSRSTPAGPGPPGIALNGSFAPISFRLRTSVQPPKLESSAAWSQPPQPNSEPPPPPSKTPPPPPPPSIPPPAFEQPPPPPSSPPPSSATPHILSDAQPQSLPPPPPTYPPPQEPSTTPPEPSVSPFSRPPVDIPPPEPSTAPPPPPPPNYLPPSLPPLPVTPLSVSASYTPVPTPGPLLADPYHTYNLLAGTNGPPAYPVEPTSRPPPLPPVVSVPSPPRSPSPQTYSLPPPLLWPPARSEYPDGKDFRLIFDPLVDKDRDGHMRALAEKLRECGADQGAHPRLKGKGKGKEIILRYNGEVIEGEPEPVPSDPRRDPRFKSRPSRAAFIELKYEYDANSTGPPPATSVLVLNISPLTPNHHIRRHFSAYGQITSFEPQIDKASGGTLGIVLIKFESHDEAKRCVEKEHGRRPTTGIAVIEGEDLKVVFDSEGQKLKAVMRILDERRRRERDEKRRQEKEAKLREANALHMKSTPTPNAGTSMQGGNPWRAPQSLNNQPMPFHRLPPGRQHVHMPMSNGRPQGLHGMSQSPIPHNLMGPRMNGGNQGQQNGRLRRPPAALVRARISSLRAPPVQNSSHPFMPSSSSSSTPIQHRGRRGTHFFADDRDPRASPFVPSRSPSPISRRPGVLSRNAPQKDHEVIVEELALNGMEHITIDGHGLHLGHAVKEDDILDVFEGFAVDKVLRDSYGWYVTFRTGDTARRAAMVLNSGTRTLAHRAVTVTVHPAPSLPSLPSKTRWDDAELVEQAEKIILKDLKAMLEKDVIERIVGTSIRRLVADEKRKRSALDDRGASVNGTVSEHDASSDIKHNDKGLKGLSFRKEKKREREVSVAVPTAEVDMAHAAQVPEEVEDSVPERPKKRPKVAPKRVINEDIESEDEEVPIAEPLPVVVSNIPLKRTSSEVSDVEERSQKKAKVDMDVNVDVDAASHREAIPTSKKTKRSSKKARPSSTVVAKEVVHQVLPGDLNFDIPDVVHVRLTPGTEPSLSPPAQPVSPLQKPAPLVSPLDAIAEGICDDDEDLYFLRLALSRSLIGEPSIPTSRAPTPDPESPPPFRVHFTGSARTEGYYKISHAEKSAYVAQYASRTTVNEVAAEAEAPQPQNVTSSRSNRANARRRVQGLEEINQVQRAMALSKGASPATELVKFNQLQTRKKHLRFARSPIHDWGLYAMEKISRGEMVIEYVGEIVRAQVADKREKAYERQGIGSSYLFRIDEDLVVDATKKGNLGRLINHSCDPNCTAKIITINGEKKIVIYAKQDIELGSEITYDYHFPIEQDKIPCLCGSDKCRGYLN